MENNNPHFSPTVIEFDSRGNGKVDSRGNGKVNDTFSKGDVVSARLEYNHSKSYTLCRMSDRVVRKDNETGTIFKGSLSKEQFFAIVKLHNSQHEDDLDPQEEFDNLEEIKEIERD